MNTSAAFPLPTRLKDGFATLRQQVAIAARQRVIPSAAPTIIGASKSQPGAVLEAAIAAGMTHFGENKVQEAAEKWPALKQAHPGLVLHGIGPLQSNKAAQAVALFDVIHTIDRAKIADAVANEAAKQGRELAVLIQVNTGEEPQKAGIRPQELGTLIQHYRDQGLPGLKGLMCVPPEGINPAPHFALLQKLAGEYGLPWLSMGMSGDYLTAIRFGATHIRIGTALFGERT